MTRRARVRGSPSSLYRHYSETAVGVTTWYSDLQEKLASKKDDEIGTVKSTAQKEMKNFSSLLCAEKHMQKRLCTEKDPNCGEGVALKDDWSKSLIIFELPVPVVLLS